MSKVKEWIVDTGTPEFIGSRVVMLQGDGYSIEYLQKLNEGKMMSFAYKYREMKGDYNEQLNELNKRSAEIGATVN